MDKYSSHGKCDENCTAGYLTTLFYEIGKRSLLTSVSQETKCRDKKTATNALKRN